MDDLLKKLNTLVAAQVNDLTAKLPSLGGKPDVSRQIADLRERVNTAMAREEELRNTVLTLRDEIAKLDSQVNQAVQNGQEPIARALLEQMQRLEKRLGFAEADLRQHQAAAADLIGRVSAVEALVQNQKPTTTEAAPQNPQAQPATAKGDTGSIGSLMDAALGQTTPPEQAKSTPTPSKSTAPKAKNKPSKPKRDEAAPQPVESATPKTEAEQPVQEEVVEKPYTAKDLARDAREEAEEQLQRTNQGVESVGGMLRDLQARTKSRMDSLDKMLREGGLLDDPSDAAKSAADKAKADKDLEDRLSRLRKPD